MAETTRSTRRNGTGSGSGSAHPQVKIVVPDDHPMVGLLGFRDELLHTIERAFSATDIHVRGNEITITGPPAESGLAAQLFEELIELLKGGAEMTPDSVERTIGMLRSTPPGTGERPADILTVDILSSRGRTIRPKTVNQKRYVEAIDKHTIVFGIGPAGTGKTYLAMAKAVKALQNKEVSRIILTRPAVEAGERLGFLPGTLYEKIDPYLRPLYDALHDMVDPDSIPRLIAAGTIEVAPLAYMRGRAQPVETPVLTPDGFRPIGDLRIGDLVVGSNGEPTPVLGVYPQGEKDIYRVTTQDGASTLASGDHLWAVATRDDRRRGKPLRVLETREMIGNLRANHYHRYEVPLLTAPVHFAERDEVPMDPYALGLLLGDGCLTGSTTPCFSTQDTQDTALAAPGQVMTITDPVTTVLRELGLCGSRSETELVPEVYLHNSVAVRLAVLQGLLDSGGEPVTQRDRTCRIQYRTTSARLSDDVTFLVQSLGGVVHHRSDAHILDIRLPADIEPFRLRRKLEKYRAAGGGRPMRFIDSIEPVGRSEAVCISVAAADSLYVTEDFLLTHNTLNDSFIILDEAQNTSPEQMKMFLTRLGFGAKIVVTGDVTQVDLPGGTQSGLKVVQEILEGVDDIYFCRLGSEDVVRHKLVGEIVDAYGRYDARQEARRANGAAARNGSNKRGR